MVYYLFAGLILLTVFTVTSWRSSVDHSTHLVYVDDDGMECPVEHCYPTVEDALRSAQPGDTVLVLPGNYVFNFSSLQSGIVVIFSSENQLPQGFHMPSDCSFPAVTRSSDGQITVACSSYSPLEYHTIWNAVERVARRLRELSLMYPQGPVTGIRHENNIIIITVDRPLSSAETNILNQSGLSSYRIYREYGPPEHQCEDHIIDLVWRREGNPTNNRPDMLPSPVYESIVAALKTRFGDVFVTAGHPFESRDTSILRVLFRHVSLGKDDLHFINSLIPENYTVEVWINVRTLTMTSSSPPFVKMTCGIYS